MEFKTHHLVLLCITAFFAMAGGALITPVLPEMVGPLHTTTQGVGMLMSVFTISTAIFTLIIGQFIDCINRKKILVTGLVIYGCTGLVSFFVSDVNSLLVMRFIQGIGVAAITSLAMLIIGDVYTGIDCVGAMSKISISFALGSVFAPIIGGGLATFGWNYAFLFYALSLPFALVVMMILPETRKQKELGSYQGLIEALRYLKNLPILYTIFMGFSIYFLLFAMMIYVPFMLKGEFNFTSGVSGIMLAVPGMACVVMAPKVRYFASKYSLIRVIIAGFVLVGLSLLIMSVVPSIIGVVLLLLLFGLGLVISQTCIDAQIIQISPLEARGGVISIYSCMRYIGQSFSPIILGIILAYSGIAIVFVTAGVFGLIIALMTYRMRYLFDTL
ncbi:MFS transporter [Methanospirillum lacunae]|uniref:MFS transporter n=1 Tax=Methanospirillum lacunae TaxID=668570 RepID=A0A2V2N5S7_9EURY|nr:MFS transporter [Methanospirillum lacunae]PWR73865.1 MFS transporter [Methanospirillum lacunae]